MLTCWLVVPCLVPRVFSRGLFGSRIAPSSHIRLAALHSSAQSLPAGPPVLLLFMGILSINEPLLNHHCKLVLSFTLGSFWGGAFLDFVLRVKGVTSPLTSPFTSVQLQAHQYPELWLTSTVTYGFAYTVTCTVTCAITCILDHGSLAPLRTLLILLYPACAIIQRVQNAPATC